MAGAHGNAQRCCIRTIKQTKVFPLEPFEMSSHHAICETFSVLRVFQERYQLYDYDGNSSNSSGTVLLWCRTHCRLLPSSWTWLGPAQVPFHSGAQEFTYSCWILMCKFLFYLLLLRLLLLLSSSYGYYIHGSFTQTHQNIPCALLLIVVLARQFDGGQTMN